MKMEMISCRFAYTTQETHSPARLFNVIPNEKPFWKISRNKFNNIGQEDAG